MKNRIKEEKREILSYGTGIGGAMFVSNVIYLGRQSNVKFVEEVMPWFGLMFLAYVGVGILFFYLYTRTPKKDSFWKYCMKGAAGIYMIGNIMPLIFLLGAVLSKTTPLRIVCILDAAILLGFYILDYHSVWKLSNVLNGRQGRTKTLLADLEEKPESVEEFCNQIRSYCEKNHQTVEFLTKGRTCEILLDGKPCTVELDSYYSQFGPMYSMKFIWKR